LPAGLQCAILMPPIPFADSQNGAMQLRCWEVPSSISCSTPRSKLSNCSTPDKAYSRRRPSHARRETPRSETNRSRLQHHPEGGLSDATGHRSVRAESPTRASALRSPSLPFDAKNIFFGKMNGVQVETELQRLASLLKGLVHEFAVMKDSIWHLEDERGSANERLDRIERVEVCGLHTAIKETNSRLLGISRQLEGCVAGVNKHEGVWNNVSRFNEMLSTIESRVASCEHRLLEGVIPSKQAKSWNSTAFTEPALEAAAGIQAREALVELSECERNSITGNIAIPIDTKITSVYEAAVILQNIHTDPKHASSSNKMTISPAELESQLSVAPEVCALPVASNVAEEIFEGAFVTEEHRATRLDTRVCPGRSLHMRRGSGSGDTSPQSQTTTSTYDGR